MIGTSILLKTPKVFLLDPASFKPQSDPLMNCGLQWKQQKLIVTAVPPEHGLSLPVLQNQQWLQECLSHSPVNAVCIDGHLGKPALKFWADACSAARKQLFVRLPYPADASECRSSRHQGLRRLLNGAIALLLTALLMPLLLGLMVLIRIQSDGPIFLQQWQVGYRGQVFKSLKFRTGGQQWIKRLDLHELPQLVNVLRGEMSLLGPRALTLSDAVQMEKLSCRLNVLPGILQHSWNVDSRELAELEGTK